MENHSVTKRDPNAKTEELIAENLSLYEAYSLVVDSRAKRDGSYYRIGTPNGWYT